jgi:hypothetical protein
MVDPWRVRGLLERLRPDAIEVSDRLTLRGLGRWAAARALPSVVIAHERLDRLLCQFGLPAPLAQRVADRANRRLADGYDAVVCTTAFAATEFDRIGATNVSRVPLGVDLATFSPVRRDPALHARLVLQPHLWWRLSAGSVVGGAGLGLASSAPPRPVGGVVGPGSRVADKGVEQPPQLGHGQRDELAGCGRGAPFSAVARVADR